MQVDPTGGKWICGLLQTKASVILAWLKAAGSPLSLGPRPCVMQQAAVPLCWGTSVDGMDGQCQAEREEELSGGKELPGQVKT